MACTLVCIGVLAKLGWFGAAFGTQIGSAPHFCIGQTGLNSLASGCNSGCPRAFCTGRLSCGASTRRLHRAACGPFRPIWNWNRPRPATRLSRQTTSWAHVSLSTSGNSPPGHPATALVLTPACLGLWIPPTSLGPTAMAR